MCSYPVKRNAETNHNNSFVRVNGWTLPLNYLQVVSWIVLLYCGFVFFGVVALAVKSQYLPASYICVGVFYAIHVICLLAATTINPADDNSIYRLKEIAKPLPVFNRSMHQHVIENGYCHICEVEVGGLSKHCSVCNKCVMVFDHHCKWLNNCVGQKNYRVFLLTVSSAVITSVGMGTLSIFVLVNSVQNSTQAEVWWETTNSLKIAMEALIGIKLFILIASLIMLLQLLIFHIMIITKGMTTYEYIKKSASKEDKHHKSYTKQNSSQIPKTNESHEISGCVQDVSSNGKENFKSNDFTKSNEPLQKQSNHALNDPSLSRLNNDVEKTVVNFHDNRSFTSDLLAKTDFKSAFNNDNFSQPIVEKAMMHSLPNSVPESLIEIEESKSTKRSSVGKRRRVGKRPVAVHEIDVPRPLPSLPSLSSSDPSNNRRLSIPLPPIRQSVEFSSNLKERSSAETKRKRLPSLSHNSFSSKSSIISHEV